MEVHPIQLFISFLFFIISTLFVYNSNVNGAEMNSSTLKLVQIIHRHGDRSPIRFYFNDPYKDASKWPLGIGQLITDGKERMYKIGKLIRTRYEKFLTKNPREVKIRSSGV